MDMQFIISTDEGSSRPLQVCISGSRLEFLGFAHGRKVAIEEEFGKITIRLLPVVETVPEVQAEVYKEVVPEVPVVPEVAQSETAPPFVQSLDVQSEIDKLLFWKLAGLRKQISFEDRVPPYIIFHDKTLHEMCQKLPLDLEGLKDISGVGAAKIEKYGSRFIEEIKAFVEEMRAG